ncbi:DUF3050 domain-containing protein [Hymenobacter caeli]|uniref:DUF3050 domain-containing protein n=1 Tax=Hymenobacter caeli TaxID=2735894 RepID=A0ABX2FRP6_9BACT|nr:DUF3050 domain-containing protein [Hymenobacter caeli]NRT19853.1 hypothetical protein [Hymenobacter caeli]
MPTEINSTEALQAGLLPTRQRLLAHGLYGQIQTLDDLRQFMAHHVFAVWDFMSLLKTLQRDLTCVTLPWVPTPNPATRRLINEIVLEEESDVDPQGRPTSHFELYLRAMRECGADTAPVERLLAALAEGQPVAAALEAAGAPASVRQFVQNTFDTIGTGQPHAVAAAFTYGREDLIPDMFRQLVGRLQAQFPGQLDTFIYYLDRHIQLDEEVHTPLAQQMVRELCGADASRWQVALQAAQRSLEARQALWDGVTRALALVAV